VRVGDDVLVAARAVVVATGSSAALPPIAGLREAEPWTNREATTAGAVPGCLLVLGGGVVGVEMAQAYVTLGAKVAVVEGAPRLIAREEEFASAQVADALRARGVDVRVGVKAARVARTNGGVELELEDGTTLHGDEILAAVGRRPRTDDLGLETVGLEPGRPIAVDERLRVASSDWLYAIGDVNGRVLLTHMGKYQGVLAADGILGRDAVLRTDGALSPRVIFTEPQVAAVGHTLASALEAGIRARAVDVATDSTAGASFRGRGAGGTCRLVVDTARDVIVGATFTGPEVDELLQSATIAVTAEVPLATLRHAVAPFPTRSEIWLKLLEELETAA
jgi:dihydrolipoamide dehydrogenase